MLLGTHKPCAEVLQASERNILKVQEKFWQAGHYGRLACSYWGYNGSSCSFCVVVPCTDCAAVFSLAVFWKVMWPIFVSEEECVCVCVCARACAYMCMYVCM